mmetsp:Transcript_69971/g.197463  ORF Transcript_69971/g.197463 Transcript_69971/m.197463 type:complete len:259 (+) Transcript_69971:188-964(+)
MPLHNKTTSKPHARAPRTSCQAESPIMQTRATAGTPDARNRSKATSKMAAWGFPTMLGVGPPSSTYLLASLPGMGLSAPSGRTTSGFATSRGSFRPAASRSTASKSAHDAFFIAACSPGIVAQPLASSMSASSIDATRRGAMPARYSSSSAPLPKTKTRCAPSTSAGKPFANAVASGVPWYASARHASSPLETISTYRSRLNPSFVKVAMLTSVRREEFERNTTGLPAFLSSANESRAHGNATLPSWMTPHKSMRKAS